jgi:hypothetical protein
MATPATVRPSDDAPTTAIPRRAPIHPARTLHHPFTATAVLTETAHDSPDEEPGFGAAPPFALALPTAGNSASRLFGIVAFRERQWTAVHELVVFFESRLAAVRYARERRIAVYAVAEVALDIDGRVDHGLEPDARTPAPPPKHPLAQVPGRCPVTPDKMRLDTAWVFADLAATVLLPHGELFDAVGPDSVRVLAELGELVAVVARALRDQDEATAHAAEGGQAPGRVGGMSAADALTLARSCVALYLEADRHTARPGAAR